MDFVTVEIVCEEALLEILIAELGNLGCDAFEEKSEGLVASFDAAKWSESEVTNVLNRYKEFGPLSWSIATVERKNWNKIWEENFDPVFIEDKCVIRAPFHEIDGSYEHDIIIMPKMSFGTGHHATTYQMVSFQMTVDHKNKCVLDVGSGTGILAIMAKKLGAIYVEGTDIDQWCQENSLENLALNGITDVPMRLGKITELTFDRKFDIVIANINKNVLLQEMQFYVDLLDPNGNLLLSGFYHEDIGELREQAGKLGLSLAGSTTRNNWAALHFNNGD